MLRINFQRLKEWTGAVFLTAGAQAVVQLLAFASGLLVIRSLDAEQYAYYTIANAALGAMTVLTDGGVSGGVLSQGGKVWHDRAALGGVIAAGLALRRRFALVVLSFSVPLTFLLLRHQGAGIAEAIVVAASVLPLFFVNVTGQVLEAAPRLHQRLLPLQRVQMVTNLGRLAALAAAMAVWPWAAVASLCAAVPQAWANWRLRIQSRVHADTRAPPDVQARRMIVRQVVRTLPSMAYYTLSGQLAVWLIAIFGRTESVAAVGALGRLMAILSALGTLFSILAVPRYARIPATDGRRLLLRYWQAQAVLIGACALPLLAVIAFPTQALAVLGPSYAGLVAEAKLMALGSVMAVLAGAAFSLGAARGVVMPPWVLVPCGIALQIVLVAVLPLDSILGVITFGLLFETGLWLMHNAYYASVLRRSLAAAWQRRTIV